MKPLAIILAGAALAVSGTGIATAETRAEKGEARLAKMIEGRSAGEPVSCISAMRGNRLTIIEHVGVVYDGGDTIYVARPENPATLSSWDVPVIERFGSQLCKTDLTKTVDRHTGHVSGVVFLKDFVPYTKKG